ncbi:MAG: OmpH family outer membrane protein [Saprospiraceae bacterium]
MNNIALHPVLKKSFLVVFAAVLFSFTANAQRIATVDINQILESVSDYQSAQKRLDDTAAKWQREISEEYDKIKGMYSRYQAEQVLMSDEVRAQKEEEIMNKEKEVRDLQKARFGPEGDLFKKRQELVRPIQDMVYKAIEDYANTKGFDFIFDKGGSAGIIFSNSRFDKTEDIMKSLKEE